MVRAQHPQPESWLFHVDFSLHLVQIKRKQTQTHILPVLSLFEIRQLAIVQFHIAALPPFEHP